MRSGRRLEALALLLTASPAGAADRAALYAQHCAACHGAERLGGQGPVLLPDSMGRLRPPQAGRSSPRAGRRRGCRASPTGSPRPRSRPWPPISSAPRLPACTGMTAEIEASRQVLVPPEALPARPAYDADPLNLFLVVEAGDHHVTVLDGDRFAPLDRFPSRFALHGGPKFSPDGRFVYLVSRDGWVTKYDLWGLQTVAEVRAGVNSRNLAVSSDGRFVGVAKYLPHSLVLLDAGDLSIKRVIPAVAQRGARPRASAPSTTPAARSFVVAHEGHPGNLGNLTTTTTRCPSTPVLVHSHEAGMTEGLAASAGLFALRRIALEEPLDDFMFDLPYRNLLGSARGAGRPPSGGEPQRRPAGRHRADAGHAASRLGHHLAAKAHRRSRRRTSRRRGKRDRHWRTGARSHASRNAARASSCAATKARPMPGRIP